MQHNSEYAKKWKQPINIEKTVGQVFHMQIERTEINAHIDDQKLEIVNVFKYLGFT